MKVVGFSFSKISIEKLKNNKGQIKIGTEIDVSNINPLKTDIFKGKDELIEAEFLYRVNYNPDIAKVELKGIIVFSLEPKLARQILKEWKSKKMPEDFRIFLFNVVMKKSTLKALELEDEMNLPLHIPIPSFKKSEGK